MKGLVPLCKLFLYQIRGHYPQANFQGGLYIYIYICIHTQKHVHISFMVQGLNVNKLIPSVNKLYIGYWCTLLYPDVYLQEMNQIGLQNCLNQLQSGACRPRVWIAIMNSTMNYIGAYTVWVKCNQSKVDLLSRHKIPEDPEVSGHLDPHWLMFALRLSIFWWFWEVFGCWADRACLKSVHRWFGH